MKRIVFLALIPMMVSSSAFALGKKVDPATQKIWMIIEPVDCLGNVWEKNWLMHHKNQAGKYPRAKEADIIKGFFKKKGVAILDYRSKPYVKGDPLCKTCDCPRGDTLFLLVNGANVRTMREFGFKDRFPDDLLDKPTH